MDQHFQQNVGRAFAEMTARMASFEQTVTFRMWTGSGANLGSFLGTTGAMAWTTGSGTPLTLAADVGLTSDPRYNHQEGLQRGERYGRASISAQQAGLTLDALAELVSRYRRNSSGTRQYKPEVLVDGQAAVLTAVQKDMLAGCVVIDFQIPDSAG